MSVNKLSVAQDNDKLSEMDRLAAVRGVQFTMQDVL